MKCHYCGAEVKDGAVFCVNCGTRQEKHVARPAPVSEANPAPAVIEPEYHFSPDILEEPVTVKSAPVPVQENRPAYVPYGAPEDSRKTPALQLPTERSLTKMIFLGILTLGIYPLVIWCRIVTELNIAASRYDGERTMSYLGVCLLTPVTLCIYPFVWSHDLCRRIGAELSRRDIGYKFGARTFWLWNVLGCLILVGPFVFTHKLMKAMNLINRDFNIRG